LETRRAHFATEVLVAGISALVVAISGCADSNSAPIDGNNLSQGGPNYLYVASGACYGGGTALSASSATVTKFNLSNGSVSNVVLDYNSFSPGDQPVGIADYDSTRFLVAIENASGRRIDLVQRDGSGASTFLTNSIALSGVLHALTVFTDGSLLVSKTTAIEKFSSAKARILQGANPYVSAPGSTCATSTTLISSLTTLSNGKIIYAHAGVTPNNKFGIISATGYASTADCLAAQTAPNTLALPDALLVHSTGRLVVAYGSTTAASNGLYTYTVDPVANTIGTGVAAFTDFSIINGPSAIAEDTNSKIIYVANGNSAFNTVESFSLNTSSGVMTRNSSTPFITPNVYTKCVSAMRVMQ
jgi:hypothetical protein